MIQFNLLPDVKLEYIKAQRTRRLSLSIALLVSAAAVAILVFLVLVGEFQKKHLSDVDKDVSAESSKLQSIPQIGRILTVQNQLASLTKLHEEKPSVARLFGYLNQITPNVVSINNLTVDLNAHAFTITGNADALSSVNQYVDTLKFTKYKVKGSSTETNAFSAVVLSSFGISTAQAGSPTSQPANYTITMTYDPTIFDITQTIGTANDLDVPQIISTRSQVDQPTDLFVAAPTTTKTTTTTTTGTTTGTGH